MLIGMVMNGDDDGSDEGRGGGGGGVQKGWLPLLLLYID